MNLIIKPFLTGDQFVLKIEEFEPKEGFELFLKKLCLFFKEDFHDWYQGIESGIGYMTYQGYQLTIVWNDFPFELNFDCKNESMAKQLKIDIENYFSQME